MISIVFLNLHRDSSPFTNTELTSFYSPSREKTINFIIYTPPGYEENNTRFPVLYFLHGRGGNHFLYWGSISQSIPEADGDAGAWISKLINNEIIPPMIIVTPDDSDGFWGQENEIMITEELINHIDTNWRTIPNRTGRAIEGFSMGGMGASRYASRQAGIYCSTIIMAAPHVEELLPDWEQNRREITNSDLKIRLVVGSDDGQLEPMRILHEGLNTQIISHQFDIIPGVGHNVGELYNRVGIEGLRFHADCFDNSDQIRYNPYYLPSVTSFCMPIRFRRLWH
ncbi:MAG: alpha/beta hydrolase-fold protein [Anaerolineales bacterium]